MNLRPYGELKFRLTQEWLRYDGILLHILIKDNEHNKTWAAKPVEWIELEEDAPIPSPLIILRDDLSKQAQSLMDQLWDCGIRPTEGMGSAGSFAAQTAHLKDMQTRVNNLEAANRILIAGCVDNMAVLINDKTKD
jgi:hypothetical protein